MRQFLTIAGNAFMELVRQPVFLLLMTGSLLFEIFLAVPYYFAFGDEPKLVENSALAVLSKPVGRTRFLLAKYTGLAGALTLLAYVNLIGVLLASWMAFDAYGKTDLEALSILGGAVALAYASGGFSNFFLRRNFVSDAVLALVVLVTLAAIWILAFTKQQASLGSSPNAK